MAPGEEWEQGKTNSASFSTSLTIATHKVGHGILIFEAICQILGQNFSFQRPIKPKMHCT